MTMGTLWMWLWLLKVYVCPYVGAEVSLPPHAFVESLIT